MRVTSAQTQRSQLEYIQTKLSQLQRAQNQAATGLRFQKGSDDPQATSDVLRMDQTLAGFSQYGRNQDLAIARVNEEDRVLNNVQSMVERARELASAQVGGTANTQTRLIAKAEVDQLIQAVISQGNTQFNGTFLFGGSRPNEEPFANTPNSVPPFVTNSAPLTKPEFEVAAGIFSAPNHTAHALLADTNTLVALRDLSNALGADDTTGIQNALPALTTVGDKLGILLGDTGARMNQYETLKSQTLTATVDTKTRRSMVYDIDIAEATTNFAQAQTSYQAALTAASRVINLNVMDYLR
jgi:flagellar hook-associated protein 3 FlgL